MNTSTLSPCPCHSGKAYGQCCQPFHQGALPETAEQLMRSRYSAYALGLADYIMRTTHPKCPAYHPDTAAWRQELMRFSAGTQFTGLQILSHTASGDTAEVAFHAKLMQDGTDASFTETSQFVCQQGQWLYRSGTVQA